MASEVATQTSTPSPSPDPEYAETSSAAKSHHAPRFGTIIPNRIFVGGIDFKTNENDLRRFFSQHGAVEEVKIVTDRAGISKGYGFVTFETQDDAQKVLHEADRFSFGDKRLNISQAIRKQQVVLHSNSFSVSSPNPGVAVPAQYGAMYLTTPTGYPYTYHNGVAYFHSPDIKPVASHWPSHSRSVSGSSVMLTHPPQPVYQQPTTAYHHYQTPNQCVPPGHLQWNGPQSAVPVMYMQPSELLYQPVEPPSDGGCVQAALPFLETTISEQFMDPMVQPSYHQMHSALGDWPPSACSRTLERSRSSTSCGGGPGVSLKPRYGRSPHYTYLHRDHPPQPVSELLK